MEWKDKAIKGGGGVRVCGPSVTRTQEGARPLLRFVSEEAGRKGRGKDKKRGKRRSKGKQSLKGLLWEGFIQRERVTGESETRQEMKRETLTDSFSSTKPYRE